MGSGAVDRKVSVAPMMDWTDRHCRYFLRGFAPDVLLYTEMITAEALLRGDAARLLKHSPEEHPLALQLGGSDPGRLAEAALLGAAAGFDEINLNCGCPSDRVHAGAFGACLMAEPALVAECVAAMRAAVATHASANRAAGAAGGATAAGAASSERAIAVTVKMRIGVLSGRGQSLRERMAQYSPLDYAALCGFIEAVSAAGCDTFIVHARQAVLGGLSPKENREVPPLRYEIVQQLRRDFPRLTLVLNGGLRTVAQCRAALSWCDGVMLGREAYHRPYLLQELQAALTDDVSPRSSGAELLERMARYAERELAAGESFSAIARHLLGLYAGRSGAREFRRRLSEGMRQPGAGVALLRSMAECVVDVAHPSPGGLYKSSPS